MQAHGGDDILSAVDGEDAPAPLLLEVGAAGKSRLLGALPANVSPEEFRPKRRRKDADDEERGQEEGLARARCIPPDLA